MGSANSGTKSFCTLLSSDCPLGHVERHEIDIFSFDCTVEKKLTISVHYLLESVMLRMKLPSIEKLPLGLTTCSHDPDAFGVANSEVLFPFSRVIESMPSLRLPLQ